MLLHSWPYVSYAVWHVQYAIETEHGTPHVINRHGWKEFVALINQAIDAPTLQNLTTTWSWTHCKSYFWHVSHQHGWCKLCFIFWGGGGGGSVATVNTYPLSSYQWPGAAAVWLLEAGPEQANLRWCGHARGGGMCCAGATKGWMNFLSAASYFKKELPLLSYGLNFWLLTRACCKNYQIPAYWGIG